MLKLALLLAMALRLEPGSGAVPDVQVGLWPKQQEFVQAPHSRALYSGGYGAGKTYGLIWRQLRMTMRFPGVPHGLACPTYKMLKRDVLPELRRVLRAQGVPFKENKSDHWLRPAWCTAEDSGLWFASCDDPDSLKGPNWGTVGINEPGIIKRDAYDVLVSRARVPLPTCETCGAWRGDEPALLEGVQPSVGDVYDVVDPCPHCGQGQGVEIQPNYVSLAGTPEGLNWLYDEWVDEGAHPQRNWADWLRLFATSYDNPAVGRSYGDSLLEAYDEDLAQEKVFGRFGAKRKGAMYPQFSRTVHEAESCVYEPQRQLELSWDFNVGQLCAVVGQMHGNALWVIDEIVLEGGAKTADAMTVFCDRYGAHQAGIRVHGDATGRRRDTRSKGLETDYAIIAEVAKTRGLRDFAFEVAESNPRIRERVNRVNGALRNSQGKVRLWIHPRCRILKRDLETQRWKPGTDTPETHGDTVGNAGAALGYLVLNRFPLAQRVGGYNLHA